MSEAGVIAGLRRGKVYISKGPRIDFTAKGGDGQIAGMWETVPKWDQPIEFQITYRIKEPLLLFVIRNGYILHVLPLEEDSGDWQTQKFTDRPREISFYRIELHKMSGGVGSENFPGTTWRDYSTMQAMSNPIWVGQKGKCGERKDD